MSKKLLIAKITTPLGPMAAIVDDDYLYLLEFEDCKGLEKEVDRLKKSMRAEIVSGRTRITDQIERELEGYFKGQSFVFSTPCFLLGSDFQKAVWKELRKIPAGKTRSYVDIANSIGKLKAYRAVANANGANQLALIVPCHRVINKNGQLGGYAGGVDKKTWLLAHEKGGGYV
ncbi:MAG: methylated-DNA--[protein]-cysteine S-methyltransferase [Gammaproteobacteria bacterium]